MQFKDVIGQKDIQGHLVDMVQHSRLSHALLFLGREGVGSLATALAFAQYVVCEKVNGMDSCNECSACIKSRAFVHPDIHYSYPVIPKKSGDKTVSTDYISEWREFLTQNIYGNAFDWLQSIGAENKQGNITVYECEDILHKLNLKSFESEYKILVMWLPEYLGNMGNKLLKIIEEPPSNTVLIFVAENELLVLPTILSRCQLVKIPLLPVEDIQQALVTRCNMESNQAGQIAGISDGNYREALQVMQHAEGNWQDLLREWLNAVLKTGPVAQVKWIDEISKLGREKQKQFLRFFNHVLGQSIRLKVIGENNMPHVNERDMDFMIRLNKLAGISQQKAIIEELDKAAYYIERNAHPRMLFLALTIKLYHIIRDNSMITSW